MTFVVITGDDNTACSCIWIKNSAELVIMVQSLHHTPELLTLYL
jgi:hypothetical protein